MSLCFAMIQKGMLMMSGDSRESININGEYYSTGGNVSKIKQIGDKVIFTGGNAEVITSVIDEFTSMQDQTIENLQLLTKKYKDQFIRKYGPHFIGNTAHAMFLVGTFENGEAVLYGINSKNDCRIVKKNGDNTLQTAIVGPGESNSRAYSSYEYYRKLGGNDVVEMYQYVYNSVANEEIGGELTIFFITEAGITKQKSVIKDSREIKIANTYNKAYNADEMVFRADGEKRLWFDLPSRNFFFAGDLHAAGGTFTGTLQAVDGVFLGDLQAVGGTFTGTLVGVDGDFSGTITASTINGGTINGAQIFGGSITSNTDINITHDIRVGNNIYLGQSGQTNDRRIEFVDSGPYRSYIGFTNSSKQLELYAGNDIRINSGLDVFINALSATLPGSSYLGSPSSDNRVVSASEAAFNMTFDSNTRNLKLWSRSGDLLAQVNIA